MTVTEQGLLEREKDSMTLNMGPQHPSTHGVFRVVLEMDGELVDSAEPHIGFYIRESKKPLRRSATFMLFP